VKIEIVSASAGSGKTHRLTSDLLAALLNGSDGSEGSARPEGVVAITYTTRAAGELESRIREALLREGRADFAARVRDGYIGTIHSVCQRLLREFALEAGLSPYLEPVPDSERRHLFDRSLGKVIAGRESELNELARRLSVDDWKADLRAIVDKAGENGMDAAALARSATVSRGGLSRMLPPAGMAADDYQPRLLSELQHLVPVLDAAARESKAARDRATAASGALADARRFGLPAWKDQLQLAQALTVKKLAPVARPLLDLVAAHDACGAFQEDLLRMQAALFDLAGKAVAVFAAEKAASRVVDFGDMLALAHDLLAKPPVQEALRARLDLVLVDEFQDTSPIQLAVVAGLGALAKRSIWVGDRKQAIFGFQGSDPELMSAAMDAALQGAGPSILARSYRSRPALVDLSSDLFATALAPHGYPEAQVRLDAARDDPPRLANQHAFEAWRWVPGKTQRDGKNVSAREAEAVVAGVEALLANPPTVREKVLGADDRLRPAARRDLAVLAFSNAVCRRIAAALLGRGIPAKVSLAGLAGTPEAILARAALALLADPSDGVAALELSWLGGAASADPDGWLSRRLVEVAEWRKARDTAQKSGARGPAQPLAFESDPRVAALRGASEDAAVLSPAEALDLALRAASIPELLRSWPDSEQRLANMEALRAEARAFEDLCGARHNAGTVLGLVAHLSDLDDAAEQAAPSAEDAVTVSTWHGAKGLEWPVVVLSNLDHDRSRNVFDVAVEPAAKFSFADPLAGRWIRYWPWPYGGMSKGLAFLDRAEHTDEAKRARERDRRERLRLLYVGFTRPRDLLVWIAKADPKTGVQVPALAPLADETGKLLVELPFSAAVGEAEVRVGKRQWGCAVRELSGFPPVAAASPPGAARWYAGGGRAPRPPERVNPSSEPLPGAARLLGISRLGGRRALAAASSDMGPLGDALHAFLAADPGGEARPRLAMATRLLGAHGVAGALAPEALLGASDALHIWLAARYPGASWLREWPVRARLAGDPERLLVGEVDLFLELPDGFVLVDHKSFPGGEGERDRRLTEEWAPQLGWYAKVLSQALGKPLKAAYVHLPIRGEMAEIQLG
jgi:ATP-dependent exoDNAse (exonuclease V) beta subunit